MRVRENHFKASSASMEDSLQEYLHEGKISRELVERLAVMVYAMLLSEGRIDRERLRGASFMRGAGRGDW